MARRGGGPPFPGPAAAVSARAAGSGAVRRTGRRRVAVADGARVAGRGFVPQRRLPRGRPRERRAGGVPRRRGRGGGAGGPRRGGRGVAVVAGWVGSRACDPWPCFGGWLRGYDPG